MVKSGLAGGSELISGLILISDAIVEFGRINTYGDLAIAAKSKLSVLFPGCTVNFYYKGSYSGKKITAKNYGPADNITKKSFLSELNDQVNLAGTQTISALNNLSVPIKLNEDEVATIELYYQHPDYFNATRRAMITTVAAICGNTYAKILKTENEALQYNEDQLNLVAQNTYNLIVKTDAAGKVTWVNRAFEAATGYLLADVIGKNHEQLLIGKNTEPEKIEELRKAIRNKSSFNTRITSYSRNGDEYKVALQVNPIFSETGMQIGHISVMHDMTREEKYRESLQAAICQIKDVSTFPIESPSPIFRFSKKEMKLIFANPVARNIINANKNEPSVVATWTAFLNLCQDRNENFTEQIQINNAHYSCSVVYIKNKHYFNIYGTDITEVVEKQQELSKMKDMLSKQKAFYEEILDNIPVDIAVFNKNHSYVYLNKEAINDDELRAWMIGKDDYAYAKRKGLPEKFAGERRFLFKKLVSGDEQQIWLDKQVSNDGQIKYKERRFHFYGQGENVMGYAVDITRLKTMQELLENNYSTLLGLQTRYANIIENTHDIIFTMDCEANITFANHTWYSKMGYSEAETIGSNAFLYKAPEARAYCLKIFNQIKSGSETLDVAFDLVAADGRILECEGTFNTTFEGDKLVEIRQYLRDVTEINKVKKAQQRQREKLLLQNQTLARLSSKDFSEFETFDEALKYITSAAAKSLGVARICAWQYSGNSIRLSAFSECAAGKSEETLEFFEKDFPTFFKKLRTQLSVSVTDIFTKEITKEFAASYFKENKIASILFIPIKSNNILSGVLSCEYAEGGAQWTIEDKAFAKSIANIVSLTGEAMKRRAAEKTFEILFNKSNDPTLIIDEHLSLADCNESALKIIGATDKLELLNKNIVDISPEYQPDGQSSTEKVQKILESAHAKGHYQFEWIHKRADGQMLPVEAMLTPIILNEQQFYYTVWRDISHRKKTESDLLLKNNLLLNQNRELQQFAYIASHDLQEPIKTMIQCSELLLGNLRVSAQSQEIKFVEFMSKSSHRMEALVTALLEYSRIGNHRELIRIDCNTLLTDVINDMAQSVERAKATINIATLPEITGYPTELRQLFQNLISNALKFVPPGRLPEITISGQDIGEFWQFTVKDNGIGIEEKNFEKIFSLFKRLHNRSEFDGMGIGLAHCKKIVQLHNGDITVVSEPGISSTFCFTINKNIINENNFESVITGR